MNQDKNRAKWDKCVLKWELEGRGIGEIFGGN
jgi:hypothetical protein